MLTTINSLTMSSREIAQLTEKEHKTVMRDIRVMLKDLGHGTDSYLGQYSSNNRMYDEYNLPKRETLLLVSGYMLHVRVKIVDRLEYLESQSNKPQLPGNYLEALQHLVEKETLLLEQAHKVEFHDKVVQTNQTYKYQEAGKKIQQRPNKFVEWLREEKYIDKANNPYQRYIDQGLFKFHSGVSDFGHAYTQGRITAKGLSYFTSKLGDTKL